MGVPSTAASSIVWPPPQTARSRSGQVRRSGDSGILDMPHGCSGERLKNGGRYPLAVAHCDDHPLDPIRDSLGRRLPEHWPETGVPQADEPVGSVLG